MATTKIHAITRTVHLALNYGSGDKVEYIPAEKDDIADALHYADDDKRGIRTYFTLNSSINCGASPEKRFHDVIGQYEDVGGKKRRAKNGEEVLGWHLHQNFLGTVDPRIANEIGVKLAREIFPNFPVQISTHTNTANTHNHIILCAWNMDGKKWNNCNANYRKIREVSDRLCLEYGLHVLEGTRDQKLIRFEDKDGNIHYYEPTERKNELLRMREAGELGKAGVGSFLHSVSYDAAAGAKESNLALVRDDIDALLPVADSYEHLLTMLREIGYEIKDKKKDGAWRKHISFQAPNALKATRDSQLDEAGFYLRESLTRHIEGLTRRRGLAQYPVIPKAARPPLWPVQSCRYGEVELSALDPDRKAVKMPDGKLAFVPRGEAEKKLVLDIRKKDEQIKGLVDTQMIERLILEREARKKSNGGPGREARARLLIAQIEESLSTLRIVEQKQITTYEQMTAVVERMTEKYHASLAAIEKAQTVAAHLEQILRYPELAKDLERRVQRLRVQPEYMSYEYDGDMAQLQSLKGTVHQYGLDTQAGAVALEKRIAEYKRKAEKLAAALPAYRAQLAGYDQCVRVLSRIDMENGIDVDQQVEQYQAAKERNQQAQKSGKKKRETER